MKNDKQPVKKSDIQQHPDQHIDQDFPGFPHAPSTEQYISPDTASEKINADTKNSNNDYSRKHKHKKQATQTDIDEQASDGSGGAFAASEE